MEPACTVISCGRFKEPRTRLIHSPGTSFSVDRRIRFEQTAAIPSQLRPPEVKTSRATRCSFFFRVTLDRGDPLSFYRMGRAAVATIERTTMGNDDDEDEDDDDDHDAMGRRHRDGGGGL